MANKKLKAKPCNSKRWCCLDCGLAQTSNSLMITLSENKQVHNNCAKTLSITTHSLMTFGIIAKKATLSIMTP